MLEFCGIHRRGPRNDSAFSSVNMRADEIFRTIRAILRKTAIFPDWLVLPMKHTG